VSNVTVIVPARGGSTRIPRKNIVAFNGEPMISWPIRAALAAQGIDRVIVSSDDDEITEIALKTGAEAPFVRPGELATDHAGTAPVIVHAIDALGLTDDHLVMCLYPTAAVTPGLLEEAIHLSRENPEHFVISVGRHRSPLERSLVSRSKGTMEIDDPSFLLSRTQDLPPRFFDAGKFYIAPAGLWRSRETMMSEPFIPMLLPDWASVDIDEPEDWPIAEALHRIFVLEAP